MADGYELERQLRELGAHVDWAPDDDVSPGVVNRLRDAATPPAQRRRLAWHLGRPVAATVALPLVVALALAVSPAARSTVADWLGVRGERIRRVDRPPTTLRPAPLAGKPDLGLGPSVSLAEARRQVGINVLVPTLAGLTVPDGVHVVHPPATGEVALVYAARADLPAAGTTGVGLLITVFRGGLEPGLFNKTIGPGTKLERVPIHGARGYWIEGAPHEFFYTDARGQVHTQTVRLAANVLLWERNGLTIRVESALSRDSTLRIADSMR